MERLAILAPALIPAAYMIGMFLVYAVRCALGRPPAVEGLGNRHVSEVFGAFFTRYFLWLIQPILWLGVVWRVNPNRVTAAALVLSAGAGFAIATGHLATAGWLYILAGALDVIDGRLARATHRQTRAGGFLDSVGDRWGEIFVLSGFVWYLRDSAWQAAAVLAIAGSVMVSYTRARGEGVGLKLDGGIMQRAERVALVAVGTLVTAWFDAGLETAEYGPHVIGAALLITGAGATFTALGRWREGYRRLRHLDELDAELEAAARADTARDGPRGDHPTLRAC